MRSGLGLILLGLASVALSKQNRVSSTLFVTHPSQNISTYPRCKGKGGDDDNRDGDNDPDDLTSTTSSAAGPAATNAVMSNSTSTLTGDSVCLPYMCVSAVVNDSEVQCE